MRKFSILLIFLSIILTAGCSLGEQTYKTTQNITQKESDKEVPYESIEEYHQSITGEHMKISELKITQRENILILQMDLFLSDFLLEKMTNTKNPFYFTFAEIPGNHKLSPLIREVPTLIEGDLSALLTEEANLYSITQEVKLREGLSKVERDILYDQANYQFAFLNEDKKTVAAILGLETSTIEK